MQKATRKWPIRFIVLKIQDFFLKDENKMTNELTLVYLTKNRAYFEASSVHFLSHVHSGKSAMQLCK